MKKLTKLNLKQFDPMTDQEMKNIVGGAKESNLCYAGELLFSCIPSVDGIPLGGGGVCAKTPGEAKQKTIDELYNQPWWEGYTFDAKCS